MNLWKTLPFAASLLAVQAVTPSTSPLAHYNLSAPQSTPTTVPLYRVTVVQGSAIAINYRNLKSTTKIDLKGTVLHPLASGDAEVKSRDGVIQIEAKFKNLPPASTFGGEYLTFVLWGVSTEGRATNLGELIVKHGKAKVEVTEKLQTFGLVVTAEPYFAVSQPSDVVVLMNAIRKGNHEQMEVIDAKYELLKRGQYTMNMAAMAPVAMDEHTPFVVYQARNAVRIAREEGATAYAHEAFSKAEAFLSAAENEHAGKKARIINAREAVQRAEDARTIAVEKQKAEFLALEQKAAQEQVDRAKQDALVAAAAEDAAREKARLAEQENAGLRSQNAGLQSRNAGLRSKLMEQLNSILQTRATARGLIVNMSGVLFQNGKATLLPAAREKLAKIAGILATHKGLKLEADGYTDSTGSDAFNLRLSEQRAENTRDYLVSQGVAAGSIISKGFGKESPIATNDTDAGRQENRRVELVVSGEGITAE